MNPLFTLRKIRDEGNWLGYTLVQVLHFNYNGEGDALALLDGELTYFAKEELNFALFGDPYSGTVFYEPLATELAETRDSAVTAANRQGDLT